MNALLEFQELVQRNSKNVADIKAVTIWFSLDYNTLEFIVNLPEGFTIDEYAVFTEKLNFVYDNGYGSQQLYGTIWFNDGTWATRGEYDGHEWWDYHKCPPVKMMEPFTYPDPQVVLDNPENYGLI